VAYLLAPETTVEHFTRIQKMIFIAFFPINFSSTALFKNAFLGFDLAGRRLVVILSNLVLAT